jgi:CheY-like chemotaxis protein
VRERLVLIHWHQEEADERAELLRAEGWEVEVEAADGADAAERIRNDRPAVVVISLARLPSHGRETAVYLRDRYTESELPVVFVDGDPEKVEGVRDRVPEAVYTTWDEVASVLQKFARSDEPDAS